MFHPLTYLVPDMTVTRTMALSPIIVWSPLTATQAMALSPVIRRALLLPRADTADVI